MTLFTLLRTLRDRWLHLVVGLLVGLVVAGAVCWLTPRTYASTSTLYVSATADSANAQNAYQGSLLSQQRIKSYTELMTSERVLGAVRDRVSFPGSTANLAREVSVSSASESTIIGVTVTDRDPTQAATVADAIGARFVEVVGELERPRRPGAAPAVTVDVIDEAAVATAPVTPQVPVTLALGAVLGLVVGAAVAAARGVLDTTVRTAGELAEVSASPVLAALPTVRALIGATTAPPPADGPYGEAVRRLRTNLLFAAVDEPARTIAVTSSLPGEGKTTLVCALASALGRSARVVVVEGDLRRPTIASRLGLASSVGFTDVLTRRVALEKAVQRWPGEGVDVLVCGTVPPNPNELLSSHHTWELIGYLQQAYDYVLLDGPPLLPVADGAILASYASCTVLLTREGVTTRSQVEKATEALRLVGARLFGTVLTMSSGGKKASSYGGYYGPPSGAPAATPPPAPPQRPRPAPVPRAQRDVENAVAISAEHEHSAGPA